MEKYARKCSISGKGINSGFVINDGDVYCAKEKDALKICQELGYDNLQEAYDEDVCYFTEWEECDEDSYYDLEGNEYQN